MKNDDIKLFDLLLHIPNYMSKRDCETLIKYHNNSKESSYYENSTTPQGIQKFSTFKCVELKNPKSLEFAMLRFAVADLVKKYRNYLESFDSFHNSIIRSGAFNYVHKYRILEYTKGASIHQHSDHMPFGYGSCTINLNEDYKGGEFTFFNGKNELNLKQGDAIIFPADQYWVHEVKPIISGTRYSFNCFLNKIKLDVMNNLNSLANSFPYEPPDPYYVGQYVDIVSEEELNNLQQNVVKLIEKPTDTASTNTEYQ
jgi:hypothetical protein